MTLLHELGAQIVIYEPTVHSAQFRGHLIENDIKEFMKISDIIVANRISNELNEVSQKVYTRDLFNRD